MNSSASKIESRTPNPDFRIPVFLWLALLLAGAFALRLHGLSLVHFNIDESLAATVASQIAQGHRFPLTGIQTSFGFYNPPLFLYLLAPFFAVSANPLFAQGAFAVLGTAAVWFVWRAGWYLGGARVAWIAAILLAFCPNAIEHSRRLWGHDLIVFCGAVAMWGALCAWRTDRWRPLAISFIAAGAAQCVHLSGILLWLPGLVVFFSRGRPMKALYAGAAFLALMYLPWIIEEIRESFPQMRHLRAIVTAGEARRDLGLAVGPFAAWALVLADFWSNDLLGPQRPWMVSRTAAAASFIVTICVLGFLAAGIYRCVRPGASEQDRTAARILLSPLLLTPVVFGIILSAAVPPYQLPALVPAVLAAAWAMAELAKQRPRILFLLMIVYIAASVTLTAEVRSALAAGEGPNISLRERMKMIQLIAEKTGGQSFALMQNGRNPEAGMDVAWLYLVYWAGVYDNIDAGPLRAERLYVIREHRARLRPPVLHFLNQMPSEHFQNATLHTIPPEHREHWLATLQAYPAPS